MFCNIQGFYNFSHTSSSCITAIKCAISSPYSKEYGEFLCCKIILNYLVNYAKLNSAKLIEYNITSIISKGVTVITSLWNILTLSKKIWRTFMKRKFKFIDYLYITSCFVFFAYLISIFVINISGRVWVNYDIYSDAILSKYIATSHTLFPQDWHYGNQIYTVATPVLSALFYVIIKDSYLALALASCIMTSLCIVFYIWCIKPFVKNKTILISLLILIGGVVIGGTAYDDITGLQVFYTMASYYSCYIIGIFVTLGISFRLLNKISVRKYVVLLVFLLNFALGMQSLREMLVLNLPLLVASLLGFMICKLHSRDDILPQKRNVLFVIFALIANTCGVFVEKILVKAKIINQQTILKDANNDFSESIMKSLKAFADYIGVYLPKDKSDLFEVSVALVLIAIVVISVLFIVIDVLKNKKLTTLGFCIVFFVVSLCAVFCSGILLIQLRPIYYFCWYLLVLFCVVYLLEKNLQRTKFLKTLLIIGLLCISILNYKFLFFPAFNKISIAQDYYQEVNSILLDDNIKYLYSDWRTEQNVISTVSRDKIVYGTLKFSNDPDDLWDSINYLYSEKWFDKENFDNAYIVLSDKALNALETEFSQEYRKTFMANLELAHIVEDNGYRLYFYYGSEKMFDDMIN